MIFVDGDCVLADFGILLLIIWLIMFGLIWLFGWLVCCLCGCYVLLLVFLLFAFCLCIIIVLTSSLDSLLMFYGFNLVYIWIVWFCMCFVWIGLIVSVRYLRLSLLLVGDFVLVCWCEFGACFGLVLRYFSLFVFELLVIVALWRSFCLGF